MINPGVQHTYTLRSIYLHIYVRILFAGKCVHLQIHIYIYQMNIYIYIYTYIHYIYIIIYIYCILYIYYIIYIYIILYIYIIFIVDDDDGSCNFSFQYFQSPLISCPDDPPNHVNMGVPRIYQESLQLF